MGVAKEILGEAVKNVRAVGRSGSYLQAAAKGAATMGAIGGVSEWAQGGSFVAGAKSNLVSGAALGVAGRAANIGISGDQWQKSTVMGNVGRVQDRVSGSVKTLYRNSDNVTKAAGNMAKGAVKSTGKRREQLLLPPPKLDAPAIRMGGPIGLYGPTR